MVPFTKSKLLKIFEARSLMEEWVLPAIIKNLASPELQSVENLVQHSKQVFESAAEAFFDYYGFLEMEHEFIMHVIEFCGNTTVMKFHAIQSKSVELTRMYSYRRSITAKRTKRACTQIEKQTSALFPVGLYMR